MARTEDPFQRRRLLAGDESGGLQRRKGVERGREREGRALVEHSLCHVIKVIK